MRGRLGALVAAARAEGRLASVVGSIIGSQVVTGLLGVVFWGLAARTFPHAAVGAAGAGSATVLLVATFALVGQGSLLVSELPLAQPTGRRALVRSATLSAGVAALVLGSLLFAVVGSLSGGSFADYRVLSVGWLVAVASCVLTTESSLYDQAMLVVDRPRNQVLRNAVSSVTRVVALLVADQLRGPSAGAATGAVVLLAVWTVGWVPSNLLARHGVRRATSAPDGGSRRRELRRHLAEHGRSSLQHHGISVALASGFLLQPVVIGAFLDAEANARFTAVRLASGLVLMVPYAIARGLFTSSTDGTGDLVARSRRALAAALGTSLLLVAGVFVLAGPAVRLLGGDFAGSAAGALRLMALAGPLLVFKDQYIAVARVRRDLGPALRLSAVGAVLEVGAIAAGSRTAGLDGALVGWLLALVVQAVVSARRLRALPLVSA